MVWKYKLREVPRYVITSPQIAIRRANGNTIINNWNWFNPWSGKLDLKNAPVQAVEVTKEKKIVWRCDRGKIPLIDARQPLFNYSTNQVFRNTSSLGVFINNN